MFERMTMEETFIVTYVLAILAGILIAIPVCWFFEKEGKNYE